MGTRVEASNLRGEQQICRSLFHVEGLRCPSCASRVENFVFRQFGVTRVSLCLLTGRLLVDHTGDTWEGQALGQALEAGLPFIRVEHKSSKKRATDGVDSPLSDVGTRKAVHGLFAVDTPGISGYPLYSLPETPTQSRETDTNDAGPSPLLLRRFLSTQPGGRSTLHSVLTMGIACVLAMTTSAVHFGSSAVGDDENAWKEAVEEIARLILIKCYPCAAMGAVECPSMAKSPCLMLIVLEVDGVTCMTCVSRIEGHLRHVAGVVFAKMNPVRDTVRILYDANMLPRGATWLIEELAELGYEGFLLYKTSLALDDLIKGGCPSIPPSHDPLKSNTVTHRSRKSSRHVKPASYGFRQRGLIANLFKSRGYNRPTVLHNEGLNEPLIQENSGGGVVWNESSNSPLTPVAESALDGDGDLSDSPDSIIAARHNLQKNF